MAYSAIDQPTGKVPDYAFNKSTWENQTPNFELISTVQILDMVKDNLQKAFTHN